MVLVLVVCNCFTFHVSVCSLSLLSNHELKPGFVKQVLTNALSLLSGQRLLLQRGIRKRAKGPENG